MTRTVCVTNLSELDRLTVECIDCGASFTLPLEKNNLPEVCIGCGRAIPAHEISRLLFSIRECRKAIENPLLRCRVCFVTKTEQS